MQQSTTSRYLNECLKLIDFPALPEKLTEGVFWTKAIVLINKESNPLYALAVRGEDGEPVVSKCFTTHLIMSIDEIYPYELDKKIVEKANKTLLPNFNEWKAKIKLEYPEFKQNVFGKKTQQECMDIFTNWLSNNEKQASVEVKVEVENEQ
jgi:hypothetical protein